MRKYYLEMQRMLQEFHFNKTALICDILIHMFNPKHLYN